MGIVTYEMEVSSAISPATMFKAFALDADNLIPKVLPHAISSVEILQGNGEAGTIKKINFGPGSQFKYVKHQIDSIDRENFKYNYTVIEGDMLTNTIEKICNELEFVASAEGGSVCKSRSKYYTTGDVEIKEEDIKAGKERASGMFKAMEAYLLANPAAC